MFFCHHCTYSPYLHTNSSHWQRQGRTTSVWKRDNNDNHLLQHQMTSNFKANPLFVFSRLFLFVVISGQSGLLESVSSLSLDSPVLLFFFRPVHNNKKLKPPLVQSFTLFWFCHDSAWQPEEKQRAGPTTPQCGQTTERQSFLLLLLCSTFWS